MPLGAFRLNSIAKVLGGPPAFNTITATGGTVLDYQDSADSVWYRSHTFETSRVVKTVEAGGNVQTSTAQFRFGSSSALFDGTGDFLYCRNHSDYAFGTTDFTIEFWVRNTSWATTEYMMDARQAAGTVAPQLFYNGGVRFATAGTTRITGGTLTTNTWHHIAISRSGTNTRLFINGTQSGSTYTDTNNYTQNPINFGADFAVANGLSGNLDEIRISRSARYTANFTAPSSAFVNDANTVLLLHCEGTNTQQRFIDDSAVTATFQVTSLGSSNGKVQYLAVGGGGGGGSHDGLFRTPGGGGAGGLLTGVSTVTSTSYTVSIGAAGAGPAGRTQPNGALYTVFPTTPPISGTSSAVFGNTANGGGGAGMYQGTTGLNGGSGGGAGAGDGITIKVGGTGTAGQGFAGGNSGNGVDNGDLAGGGGGGGASGAGSNGVMATNKGGAGGAGVNNTYRNGTVIGYAGGGGGAGYSATQNNTSQGGAATHGGGAGNAYGRGSNGVNGTGGGGGGGNGLGYVNLSGGDGGTGIVVVRYPLNSANNLP